MATMRDSETCADFLKRLRYEEPEIAFEIAVSVFEKENGRKPTFEESSTLVNELENHGSR